MIVKILKAIGWIFPVLIVGLAGTAAIGYVADSFIESKTGVRLPSGPSVLTDAWDRGYVSAEGTFTIDNDRQAFPIQTTKIRCHRDEKSCTAAKAEISFLRFLDLQLTTHPISLWSNTTILFTEDAMCVQYVYSIDRVNKRVVGTRTKKQNVAGCEIFQSTPLTLSLVDGFAVWMRVNQEAVAKVSPFMWSGMATWWLLLIFVLWRRRCSRLQFDAK